MPEPEETERTDIDEVTWARIAPVETFAKYFYIGLALLVLSFALSVALKDVWVNFPANFLLALALSVAVIAASSALGSLLGFLFGIPRSLQRLGPPPPGIKPGEEGSSEATRPLASVRAFASNTSLEEISDWLTKIIIGVGLVQ